MISRAVIVSPSRIPSLVRRLRTQGLKIVFTNGCFDLLHEGHIRIFRFAKSKGDILIVGVNSDHSVSGLKGSARPIVPLKSRLEVLSALRHVDYLVPFSDSTPLRLIRAVRPDVLVKGADWKKSAVVGASFAGRVALCPLAPGFSTTKLIQKIKTN